MDAAKQKKRAGFGKRDFDRLARLLGAGIEIEHLIEHPDIVGARIVVDDPEPFATPQCDMGRAERLVGLNALSDCDTVVTRAAGARLTGAATTIRSGGRGSVSVVSVRRKASNTARSGSASWSRRGRSRDKVGRSITPLS